VLSVTTRHDNETSGLLQIAVAHDRPPAQLQVKSTQGPHDGNKQACRGQGIPVHFATSFRVLI
jgi:hypothetical protein